MDMRARRASRLLVVLLAPLVLGAVREPELVDPVAALTGARNAFEAGDTPAALQGLEPLGAGPLADHAALLRARWLRQAGDLDGAQAAAEEALAHDPPSEVLSLVHLELAGIHLQRSELSGAYRAQEAAWKASKSSERSADLALEFARIFESRALPGDARQLYDRIWQSWPRAEASVAAFERGRFLSEATGAPQPSGRALLSYGDSLRSSYECDDALPVYERVLARKLDATTRRRADRGRADCLFQRRRYAEAEQAYRALAKSRPDDINVAIRAARSLARAGDSEAAIRDLSAIAKRSGRSHRAHAQYLVAIVLGEEDRDEAERLLRLVEKQRHSPGLARSARWRLAWSQIQNSDYAGAIARLRPLTRGPLSDIEVQRARYWSAVARLEQDPEAGRKELRELAEAFPLSYYGMLGADRLGLTPEIEHSFLGEASNDGPFPREQRAAWLLEAGLDESARAELESWARSGRLKRQERVAAASLLHDLGDHFAAVRLLIDGFGGALEQGIDPSWRAAWQYAWPQPFNPAVQAAVEEFEFDPALVYAVMREESTYRPDVESPAGALGLMQIIPPTGTRIASSLGVEPFAPTLLFDPSTNIRFGTYYLKYLTSMYDGSRPLAIAAYNAGPEAVNTWLERDGHLADDAFVDSVPYSETRRYLRKVIRSWRVYQLLYEAQDGADAGPQPLETPGR